jgi:hypothetical protein
MSDGQARVMVGPRRQDQSPRSLSLVSDAAARLGRVVAKPGKRRSVLVPVLVRIRRIFQWNNDFRDFSAGSAGVFQKSFRGALFVEDFSGKVFQKTPALPALKWRNSFCCYS